MSIMEIRLAMEAWSSPAGAGELVGGRGGLAGDAGLLIRSGVEGSEVIAIAGDCGEEASGRIAGV